MNTRNPSHKQTHAARAFSLIEVLIAVLVLSLGLLGLGAVFPMVVRQQRIATETNLGVSARNAIEQMLFSRPDFGRDGGRGWEALRDYVINTGGNTGNWVAVEPDDRNMDQFNTYLLPHPNGGPVVQIPLAQRLYPVPFSTDQDPRFVWDMVARLTDTRNPDTSPLMVAIFIRPIDPGIKTAIDPNTRKPYSVLSTLIDPNVPTRERRNPVSVDGDGLPTRDGRRGPRTQYARPIVAEAIVGPGIGNQTNVYETLVVQDVLGTGIDIDTEDARTLLAVPGQQFLDFQGYLHTISGTYLIQNRVRSAIISPAIVDVDGNGSVGPEDYNPIVFLPLAPHVEPIVFTVNP